MSRTSTATAIRDSRRTLGPAGTVGAAPWDGLGPDPALCSLTQPSSPTVACLPSGVPAREASALVHGPNALLGGVPGLGRGDDEQLVTLAQLRVRGGGEALPA